MNIHLKRAIDLAGGQVRLAEQIRKLIPGSKIAQAHLSNWLLRTKAPMPPAEYVIPIAQVLDWRVTPHELRPDLYPHPGDGMPPTMIAIPAEVRAA